MTWEWAFLLSVAIVCFTIYAIFSEPFGKNATSTDGFEERLSHLEKEQLAVHQLAESTKKLLSEANLAKGFRQQR